MSKNVNPDLYRPVTRRPVKATQKWRTNGQNYGSQDRASVAASRGKNVSRCNVYLPCVGTADRIEIVEDTLPDLWSWRLKYPDSTVIIGGDFNTDLEIRSDVSSYISNFLTNHSLLICDTKLSSRRHHTYVSEWLGHCSRPYN